MEDDLFDEDSFVGLGIAGLEELALEQESGIRDGASALRQGHYTAAKQMFGRALEKQPKDLKLRANYYLACGHVDRSDGRMQQARVHFERALKYDNGCQDAAYELRKLGER